MQIQNSVVLVAREVLLDSSKSKEPDLWRKLENHLGIDILDCYSTLSTGSGFVIDSNGHVLTNHHVIDGDSDPEAIRNLTSAIQDFLTYSVPEAVLSRDERFKLRADTAKILDKSKSIIHVISGGKTYNIVSAVAKDRTADLALIKTESLEAVPPLQLSPDKDSITLGSTVVAFGYPVPDLFGEELEKQKVSVTMGNISALREQTLGLQHTAPINPGNSGGPLIDQKGLVVGINSGMLRNTNGIYFAIDASLIQRFLVDSGNGKILEANQQKVQRTPQYNGQRFSAGTSVVINSEEGAEVFYNEKKIGTVPLVFKMTEDAVKLTVRSDNGTADLLIQKDASISRTITIEAVLKPYTSILKVDSSPQGAKVSIDGKQVGIAPYEGRTEVGNHSIQLELEGYRFPRKTVNVARTKETAIKIAGENVHQVSIRPACPPGTKVKARLNDETFSFIDPALLALTPGTWTITAENTDFMDPVSFTIEVPKSLTIDASSWACPGKLALTNVISGSKLFIDSVDYGLIETAQSFDIPCGEYDIRIENPKYLVFEQKVRILKESAQPVFVMQQYDREKNRVSMNKLLGLATLVGAAVSIPSFIYGYSLYEKEIEDCQKQGLYEEPEMNAFLYIGGYGTLATACLGVVFYMTF